MLHTMQGTTTTILYLTIVTSVIPTTTCCPPDWSAYDGSCYSVQMVFLSWNSAREHCQDLAQGADMASLHSAGERDFILSLYPSVIATDWLWLGGSGDTGSVDIAFGDTRSGGTGSGDTGSGGTGSGDAVADGQWAWSDGTKWDYEDWTNSTVWGTCLSYENYFGHWYKFSCAEQRHFVCKI